MAERVTWASDALGVPRARDARTHAAPRVGHPDADTRQPAGKRESWLERHPREAAVAAGVVAAAGLIRMAGAPPLAALLALGAGGLAAVLCRRRGRRQHRGHLEVVDGCRWPLPWRWADWQRQREVERETARLLSTWEEVAKVSGVPGATLRRVAADPLEGYEVHVEAHGKLVTDVKLPRFHSAAGIAVEWTVQTPDLRRPWEFVIREAAAAAAAAENDDAPPAPPPAPVDVGAERLDRIRAVLRAADGPLSGRKVAELAGVDHTWTWKTGLPELERRGAAVKVGGKWAINPVARRARPAEEIA